MCLDTHMKLTLYKYAIIIIIIMVFSSQIKAWYLSDRIIDTESARRRFFHNNQIITDIS